MEIVNSLPQKTEINENIENINTQIGNTDISNIGTGTITNAISTINTDLNGIRIVAYANTTPVNMFASSAALVRDVTFPFEMENTNYIVLATLETIKGGVTVSVTNKTTSGFRLRVDAASGTFTNGDNCNVAWIMFGYGN